MEAFFGRKLNGEINQHGGANAMYDFKIFSPKHNGEKNLR
jgi:hypothetical protein